MPPDSFAIRYSRWVRLYGVCFCAAALALSGCKKGQAPPQQTGPLPVNVITAAQEEVVEWDEYTGRLDAVESVEVRPRVTGYLTEVRFKAGDMVKTGDPLFIIDPRPYQADLDRAKASLEQAEAQRKLAALDFERADELRKKNVLSAQEYDQKAAALSQAEASVGVAQAALAGAQLNLGYTTIEAPIDGRVSDARVTVGNLVQANPTTGGILTTVVSTDPIYIYLDADENTVLRFMEQHAAGQVKSTREAKIPIYAQLANEQGFPHEGYLDFADNRLDPETGTLRMRAVFKSWDPLLKAGMFARVRIASGPKEPAVLIPDEVISSQQGVKYVYVVKPDQTVERRNLETGLLHDGKRIIRGGLKPGEQVVSTRLQMLRPGMKVMPVPQDEGQKAGGPGESKKEPQAGASQEAAKKKDEDTAKKPEAVKEKTEETKEDEEAAKTKAGASRNKGEKGKQSAKTSRGKSGREKVRENSK